LGVSRLKENPEAQLLRTHSLTTRIDWLLQLAQAFTKTADDLHMFVEQRPDSSVRQQRTDTFLRAMLTAIPILSVCPQSMVKSPTEVWSSHGR
jgi:hypothetical protein